MNRKSVVLVLVGILVGCGAAVVTPMVHSHAQARAAWGCYVVDRFPDVGSAAGWDAANDIRLGMDKAAPNVSAGTVVSVTPKSGGNYASVVCVKNQ